MMSATDGRASRKVVRSRWVTWCCGVDPAIPCRSFRAKNNYLVVGSVPSVDGSHPSKPQE